MIRNRKRSCQQSIAAWLRRWRKELGGNWVGWNACCEKRLEGGGDGRGRGRGRGGHDENGRDVRDHGHGHGHGRGRIRDHGHGIHDGLPMQVQRQQKWVLMMRKYKMNTVLNGKDRENLLTRSG
jgi:hypothetical protein